MKKTGKRDICRNKKAFFEYTLLERFEAGVELKGAEVKSIRQGETSINDSFVRIERKEALLYNMHVSPYRQSGPFAPDPTRVKKLLLHKAEIDKLDSATSQKGFTLIPTRVYLKKGFVKIEIAIAKGKKLFDKRRKLRQKTIDREIEKSLKMRKN